MNIENVIVNLTCPICQNLLYCPIVATDGICYNRNCFVRYVDSQKVVKSPIKGVEIDNNIVKTVIVRNMIKDLSTNSNIFEQHFINCCSDNDIIHRLGDALQNNAIDLLEQKRLFTEKLFDFINDLDSIDFYDYIEQIDTAARIKEQNLLSTSKFDDSKIKDSKLYDSKINDSKIDDSKLEDSKLEDSKLEDSKLDNSNFDDSKQDENEQYDVALLEEIKQNENISSTDEVKQNENIPSTDEVKQNEDSSNNNSNNNILSIEQQIVKIVENKKDYIDFDLTDESDDTLLFVACKRGYGDLAKAVLNNVKDYNRVNKKNESILYLAITFLIK